MGKCSDFPSQTPSVRPKSAVYTQKRDDEHRRHFYMRSPLPGTIQPLLQKTRESLGHAPGAFSILFQSSFFSSKLQLVLILRARSLRLIHRIFGFLHGRFCFCLWEKLNKQTNRLTWILSLIETLWSVPVPSSLPRIFTYSRPQKIANEFTRIRESFLKQNWNKQCTEQQKFLHRQLQRFPSCCISLWLPCQCYHQCNYKKPKQG